MNVLSLCYHMYVTYVYVFYVYIYIYTLYTSGADPGFLIRGWGADLEIVFVDFRGGAKWIFMGEKQKWQLKVVKNNSESPLDPRVCTSYKLYDISLRRT